MGTGWAYHAQDRSHRHACERLIWDLACCKISLCYPTRHLIDQKTLTHRLLVPVPPSNSVNCAAASVQNNARKNTIPSIPYSKCPARRKLRIHFCNADVSMPWRYRIECSAVPRPLRMDSRESRRVEGFSEETRRCDPNGVVGAEAGRRFQDMRRQDGRWTYKKQWPPRRGFYAMPSEGHMARRRPGSRLHATLS